MTRKRVLFVDDDPDVLAGLRGLLRKENKRWDVGFALGGEIALAEIEKTPFDVVLSDMGMPGLDGVQLLDILKEDFPAAVRILLSGCVDREAIIRAVPVAHRLLSKPCDATTLRSAIERGLAGTDVGRDVKIRRIIVGIDGLPTPPDIYFDLTRLMQRATSSVTDVAQVVTRDPGLAAKLLQVVNTTYFGAGQLITSIQQAVARLGTEHLRYLALSTFVFSSESDDVCGVSLQDLQRRATRAANLAKEFAAPAMRDAAFAATLFHGIGHIVLARGDGPEFQAFRERSRRGEAWLDLEIELFGVSHADVGAHLLTIWGLPLAIVDAIQFHHDPGSGPEACRQLASIMHVAEAVVQGTPPLLNIESLERAGCAHLVPNWMAIAERSVQRA